MTGGERRDSDYVQNVGKVFAIYICGVLAVALMLTIAERLGAGGFYISAIVAALLLSSFAIAGLLAGTRSAEIYFAAGREIPPVYNGMAAAAQWMSAPAFLGLTGTAFIMGYDGLAYLTGLTGGLVVMGVLIVPYLRRLGAATVPDFFGARFGGLARFLSLLVVIAVGFVMLIAQLNVLGAVGSHLLHIPYDKAVWGGLAALLLTTILGGMRSATWTQAAQYAVIAAALLLPAALYSMHHFGWPLPQLTYGQALQQISVLEVDMIEKGFADARTLKPHATPFVQLDPLNFFALVFSLMAGVASLPHLLMRFVTTRNVRDARTSVAWSAFFVLIFAITIPAYAAFAKLEIYALIAKATPMAELPGWMAKPSRLGLLKIHGVSLDTLDAVIGATQAGAADAASAGQYLAKSRTDALAAFAGLKEPVKTALIEAAKNLDGAADETKWEAFRQTVLPAAAKAAGNKTGMLTHGALGLDPRAIMISLPLMINQMAGMPAVVTGIFVAGLIAACLAAATGLLLAMSNALGHDLYYRMLDRKAPEGRRIGMARLAMLAVGSATAYAAVTCPIDIASLYMWAFSIAAAGLFPVLVLGIWWKRTNAFGAAAGMAAGLGLCLYYLIATRFFPVQFYETWSCFSNAGDSAALVFQSLRENWSSAQGDAKAAAWTALERHALGTPAAPGLANWFGLMNVSAALFSVPVGFAVTILVSLITPRPAPEIAALVDQLRRPGGPQIL